MRKLTILLITPLLFCGCKNRHKTVEENLVSYADYAAFLGRIDNDVTNFSKYKYVSFEFDEYGDSNITRLTEHGLHCFAYLNVGSLETYRDYYEYFEGLTFKDYDNWPDERWIDITDISWQNYVVNNLAQNFKDRKAYGIYLDNVDVYSIAREDGLDYQAFATGLKNVIKGISDLGLKVMINGGAEFLNNMNDQNDSVFDYIWAYHQEEVFSLITDYEHDGFGTQSKEDREYYQTTASMMKAKGKEIFFLEYTTNNSLKDSISKYCDENQYHYYISNNVDLK